MFGKQASGVKNRDRVVLACGPYRAPSKYIDAVLLPTFGVNQEIIVPLGNDFVASRSRSRPLSEIAYPVGPSCKPIYRERHNDIRRESISTVHR